MPHPRCVKKLRKIHLYLGCIFSPMLIFFAATGAAQMFGLNLGILSRVHEGHYASLPFVFLAVLMGLSVIITSLLGISMAFRTAEDKNTVWACLIFGVAVPVFLLLITYFKTL
jgi:hypothetical protein